MADFIRVRLIDRNRRCINTQFRVPLPRTLSIPYGNMGQKTEFKYAFVVAYGHKHEKYDSGNGIQIAVYMEALVENKE